MKSIETIATITKNGKIKAQFFSDGKLLLHYLNSWEIPVVKGAGD